MKRLILVAIPAAWLAAAPAAAQYDANWKFPTSSKIVNYGFFDPRYNDGEAKADWRQHLGLDLKANTSTPIYAPVKGYIIFNNTQVKNVTPFESYIIIKDVATGFEHVLGHISATRVACGTYPKCSASSLVYKGDIVGYPRYMVDKKGRQITHAHWGVNCSSVSAAKDSVWGWGRAPYSATLVEATGKRRWLNLSLGAWHPPMKAICSR